MIVEKNIQMPRNYPFEQMEVGDSFAVPAGIKRQTVNIAALRWSRKHGGKFSVRVMPDRSFRCWRVA